MTTKQKILIVDDLKENLHALRQVLNDIDVEIIEARNGNDALAATLEHKFALAILDIMMPGMDGYELAAHLRGDEKTKLTPIIFVSAAYTDEHHVFKGYESGGIDYIVKPIVPQILLGKVRLFLEMDRYREEWADNLRNELERRYAMANVLALPAESASSSSDSIAFADQDTFESLAHGYGEILERAVENLILQSDHPVGEQLRALADDLGTRFASARDVAVLHSVTLTKKTQKMPPMKSKALIEEGRFVVLELMGNLTTFYRKQGAPTKP